MAEKEQIQIKKDKAYLELAFKGLLDTVKTPKYTTELTDELMEEMLNNSVIRKCINTIIRGITSRELIVANESNDISDKRLLDIQHRINGIKYKTKLIEDILMSSFEKIAVHEIVYNEDFTIKQLVKIPKSIVKYNKDKKGYVIKNGDSEIDINNPTKWLISIFNQGLDSIQGRSLLESVMKDYQDIKFIKDKLNKIISKYGETVLIFSYSQGQTEEEIEETAKSLKQANGSSVIAIPTFDGNLRDNIFILRLNDMDTVLHERLIAKYEKNIVTTLLGGSLTIDNNEGGSSYALGDIQQEEKEKIEDGLALFVRDELDKLVDIDGAFFGYDSREYYISLDRPENEEKIIAIQKEKENLKNLKIQGIEALSRAGYEVDEEELKTLLGIENISKKEYSLFRQ